MEVLSGLIGLAFLGAVIFFSVRAAIKSVKNEENGFTINKNDEGLSLLRHIGVLSDKQLQEVIEIYNKKIQKKKYEKYFKVLEDLKQIDYFTEEQYLYGVDKLKKHFKID